LSAGGSHTCAASFDGTVRCWGSGELGQLGDNVVDASADGANDDCDAAGGSTSYCSKTAALVNWTSGVTSNATLRPKTCHKYSIP
jgi:alpha-tubulin suppressor-like RCC1 family protein